jgi:hypothetical protein
VREVRVTWVDAFSSPGGWKPLEDVQKQKPVKVVTYGLLATDEATHITVVGTLVEDGDCDGDVTIPRGWVEKIEDLH